MFYSSLWQAWGSFCNNEFMIRGNCSSLHTVNVQTEKNFPAIALIRRSTFHESLWYLSGAEGLFTRNVFSPCMLLPPLKFNIVPMVTVWTRKHSSRMRTDCAVTRMSSESVSMRLIVDRHLWKHYLTLWSVMTHRMGDGTIFPPLFWWQEKEHIS